MPFLPSDGAVTGHNIVIRNEGPSCHYVALVHHGNLIAKVSISDKLTPNNSFHSIVRSGIFGKIPQSKAAATKAREMFRKTLRKTKNGRKSAASSCGGSGCRDEPRICGYGKRCLGRRSLSWWNSEHLYDKMTRFSNCCRLRINVESLQLPYVSSTF